MANHRARDASLLMLIFALFAVAFLHDIRTSKPRGPYPVQALLIEGFDETAHGTGFYLGNHEVITAAHVTTDVADIKGRMWVIVGGKKLLGRLLYADLDIDVAIIQVATDAALSANHLACGGAAPLIIGAEIEAVGYPLGIGLTHTWGRVAAPAMRRGTNATDRSVSFIADMTVAPGNSGGPVADMHGNIVGLADALAVASLGIGASLIPLSYIVPSSVVCRTVDDEHYLETSEP